MKKLVSVIIPCRNEQNHLGKCIASVLGSSYGKENIEVFVVDGQSSDSSVKVARKFSEDGNNVHVIHNTKQVTPVAFNLGIRQATGDYILIVGARHIISDNYIEECVKKMESNTAVGCIGGRVENVYENETSRLISLAMASPVGVGGGNFRTLKEDSFVDTVGTPIYRRDIFDVIGYFDEDLFRNQDDELNFRLTKAGYKILFLSSVQVKYFVRASFDKLLRQYFQYGYWKVFVNRKHKTVTTFRQLVPFLFVSWLISLVALSFISTLALVLLISTVSIYLLVIFLIGLIKTKKAEKSFSLALAFICLHFGYGLGYFEGIIHFLILNRKPSKEASKLTR